MAFAITARSLLQTSLVMGCGDLGAQYLESKKRTHHQSEILESENRPVIPASYEWVDRTRLFQMTALGMTMNGLCVPMWLGYIWKRIPGRHAEAIVKKLLLDQALYAPFMLVTVLAYTSLMKDLNENGAISRDRVLEDYKLNLSEKGLDIFLADCCVWPPASLFNFVYIPKRFMVLYYSVVSVGWNTYLSYTSWRELDSKNA